MAASSEIALSRPGPRPMLQELAEINRKLDALTTQVGYLHRKAAALEELRDEMMPVARDAMGALSEELSAIEHEFNSEEVAYLLRKLLRNTPRFIRLLDRLESLDGLLAELEPLSKEVMKTAVAEFESIERRGHFKLLRGALAAADRVAAHYTEQDIDDFVDSVITIVDTVKNFTRPEVLELANEAVEVVNDEARELERVGAWKLLRAVREPQVQAGLGVALEILRRVGGATCIEHETNESLTEPTGTGAPESMNEA